MKQKTQRENIGNILIKPKCGSLKRIKTLTGQTKVGLQL